MRSTTSMRGSSSLAWWRVVLAASLVGWLAIDLSIADSARATLIVVDSTAEGTSQVACTLRDAVAAANGNVQVGGCPAGQFRSIALDTIAFSVTGTIALSGSPLTISDDLVIDGPGAANLTISGQNSVQVIRIERSRSVRLKGVTIANGHSNQGGGIYNKGRLVVRRCAFRDNVAFDGFPLPGEGGGILNWAGTLRVNNSTFSGNSASGSREAPSACFSFGGAGIANSGGRLVVANSTFYDNHAGAGGGINNGGTLKVRRCTFDRNSAIGFGGGINTLGTAEVVSSTFSGNQVSSCLDAPFAGGGAISNRGRLSLRDSTLSANTAVAECDPDLFGGTGGILHEQDDLANVYLTVSNTIIANNAAGNCELGPGAVDISDSLQFGDTSCPGFASGDPKLGPLQKNAPGFTATFALLPGSAAIDAGDTEACAPTDQRRMSRPQGAACDIGAYEVEVPAPG